MAQTGLSMLLLLVAGFSLTTWLEPWHRVWSGDRAASGGLVAAVLGDSRRLFANHFFVKADTYFHSGYYPTIFDAQSTTHALQSLADAHAGEEKEEDHHDFLGKPRDWIDRFSRHFYPDRHRHLGEKATEAHDHPGRSGAEAHGDPAGETGDERELLPWLRLAAEMDPQNAQCYVVASFWLRRNLGRVKEAEQFLREGLRANPGHPEILFELGRIYREEHKDAARARNIWELALKRWHVTESAAAEPNRLLHAQLLNCLADLEEQQGNFTAAIRHLRELKEFSPHSQKLQQRIDDLQSRQLP